MATRYSVSRKHPARTRRLIQVAKHDGIDIPKGLKADSLTWGPAHIKLAKAVQTKHKMSNQSGAPTLELRRFLFPEPSKDELAIRAALSQVGVSEHPPGSNGGTEVDKYTRAGEGFVLHEAWCGDFVKWCSDQAKIKLPRFYYPRAKAWAENLPHVAQAHWRRGHVVVFRWKTGTFHVAQLLEGVVTLPSGRYVRSVDGNRSDKVGVWLTPIDSVYAVVERPQ